MDEDFVLTVWMAVDNWNDNFEISEHKSAGTAPWSCIRLVKIQTINANINIPRYNYNAFLIHLVFTVNYLLRCYNLHLYHINYNPFRYLSEGVMATCMCLNNSQDAFIGTNSGLVFRCNLGGNRVQPSYYTSCEEETGKILNFLKLLKSLDHISNKLSFLSLIKRSIGHFFFSENINRLEVVYLVQYSYV